MLLSTSSCQPLSPWSIISLLPAAGRRDSPQRHHDTVVGSSGSLLTFTCERRKWNVSIKMFQTISMIFWTTYNRSRIYLSYISRYIFFYIVSFRGEYMWYSHHHIYKGQSNESGANAKMYDRTFITSKVITKTVSTFIPLRDKMINPILESVCELSTELFFYPVFVRCKTMSANVFLQQWSVDIPAYETIKQ